MTSWLFHLKPVTPLHIGSGRTLEAYEYAVLDSNLYCFDPYELLPKLSHELQDRFLSLVSTRPGELQRFLHSHAPLIKADPLARLNIPLTAQAQQLYQQQLDNPRAALTIFPFTKTAGKPLIPGSSLKGAIRTALLYHLMRKPARIANGRRLESQVFGYGSPSEDPFKTLKIGDSQPLPNCTQISVVRLYTRKGENWQKGPPMFHELTLSAFSSSSAPTFVHPVQLAEEAATRQGSPLELSMESIITSCRQFYRLHCDRETSYLGKLPYPARVYARLAKQFSQASARSFPVRLGWGSGFDAVTVNYALSRPQTKRSRRLAEEGIPLGWAIVEVKAC